MNRDRQGTRGHPSVQTVHLRIDSIEDDVVSLPDGLHLAVLEVGATNFALQGEREHEALISGYSAFLNSLTFPIQTLVRVLQLDLWGYLNELERRIREGDIHDELVEIAYDHIHFLRKLAQSRTLLERRFYVVVPSHTQARQTRSSLSRLLPNFLAQSREAATIENRAAVRKQLTVRSEEVERGLSRCGLRVRRLKTQEVAQLFYACWCHDLSRVQRLERDLAEYTSLVVSADQSGASNGHNRHKEPPGQRIAQAESAQNGKDGVPPLSPDERLFLLGTRSVVDLLAPASVEVTRDHIRLDDEYARVLVVTGYPRTVSLSWLSPLIDCEAPIVLSQFVYPLESAQVVQSLTHKMVQLQSSRLMADRDGKLSDPEREVAYEDAERLRDALQRGDEKVFSVSLYLLVRASTLSALDSLTHRVETAIDSMLAQSRVAILEQDRAFRCCLPYGKDELGVYRNLDTSSLATTFPFSSSSLSMERGVLYGVSTHSHSPVLFDPFDSSLENANLVIFAKSGAGKSYFTKLMAMRSLIHGVDFLVIDPEDEYRSLCSVVDGQHIRLSSSSAQHLNPFDLPQPGLSPNRTARLVLEEDERDTLAEQVASLLGLLELMLAETSHPLTNDERSLLDRALYQTYARAGITQVPSTHSRPAPLLRGLHAVLADDRRDLAQSLATRLHRYVEGSLSGLFSGPTNVALSKPFVVFNVQSLEPELRPLGIHLIASFVWNQVRRSLRPRLLVVDEAWTLMQYPEGGAFLAGLSRRARKYYLGLVTITQDVSDFLDSEQGRIVLTNASLKLLMKQDSSTIEPVVRAFQLSTEDRQYLLGAGKGEGLFFARGSHVALKVEGSPLEHRLATTAPRELAELARALPEDGARGVPLDGVSRQTRHSPKRTIQPQPKSELFGGEDDR
ncbi:MAG: ATP-binding protein [Nitrososphaerota archaeon]|nr:ATP-binding protein [Nitrososphaerota archaeon]